MEKNLNMKKQTPIQWFFSQLVSVGYITNQDERLLQERYLTALDMENHHMSMFLLWFMTKYTTTVIDGEFCFVNIEGKEVSIPEIIEHYKNNGL